MVFGGFSFLTLPGGAEILQCDRLAAFPGLKHCFTTRNGGCSAGPYSSLNMGFHLDDDRTAVEQNYRTVTDGLKLPVEIAATHQVHGDCIRTVTDADLQLPGTDVPACDGLLTARAGVTLCGRTADCVPLLLYCPSPKIAVFAHAGWRGTALNIARTAVEKMMSYGVLPERISAAVGPAIGPCCFLVHRDVADIFFRLPAEMTEDCILSAPDGRFSVNLQKINALQLQTAGVSDISVAPCCTCCDETRWFSHRRTGKPRGSMATLIAFCNEEAL